MVRFKERHPEDAVAAAVAASVAVPDGRKFDGEKNRWDLLCWPQVSEVVQVLTFGAKKYAPDNWQQVQEGRRRYFAAAMRHMVAWQAGEKVDPESKCSHLSHAVCCLLFCAWLDDQELINGKKSDKSPPAEEPHASTDAP